MKNIIFTNNSTNTELKHCIEWKNSIYSNCNDCGFKKFTAFDSEDVNYYHYY